MRHSGAGALWGVVTARQGREGPGGPWAEGRLPNPASQTKEGLKCILGQSKEEACIHVDKDALAHNGHTQRSALCNTHLHPTTPSHHVTLSHSAWS